MDSASKAKVIRGSGWFNTSLKCSTQRVFCSSCVSRTVPFLSLVGVAPCPSQILDHTEQGFGVITFGCFFCLSTFWFNHSSLSVLQLFFTCRSSSLYLAVACSSFMRVFACSRSCLPLFTDLLMSMYFPVSTDLFVFLAFNRLLHVRSPWLPVWTTTTVPLSVACWGCWRLLSSTFPLRKDSCVQCFVLNLNLSLVGTQLMPMKK